MFKEYILGRNYHQRSENVGSIVQKIERDFPGVNTANTRIETDFESFLRFKADLLLDIVEGGHTWTIRYKPGVIRWPASQTVSQKPNRIAVYFPDPESDNWKINGNRSEE